LEKKKTYAFALKDLHNNVHLFGFIAGYQTHEIQEQDPVNIYAAERMGKQRSIRAIYEIVNTQPAKQCALSSQTVCCSMMLNLILKKDYPSEE
jgi:hypothetical protein